LETFGYFDKFSHPRVRLIVKGLRKSLRNDPVVDTGFDGDLCLPVKMAIQLGLELSGESIVELADGSRKQELSFLGSVFWQGQERLVKIFLTNSEDALIGSGLMQGRKLAIDYVNHTVALEPVAITRPIKPKQRRSGK
jgi:predicted aspartyl protease